jgi:hypothetical protein
VQDLTERLDLGLAHHHLRVVKLFATTTTPTETSDEAIVPHRLQEIHMVGSDPILQHDADLFLHLAMPAINNGTALHLDVAATVAATVAMSKRFPSSLTWSASS